MPDFIEIGQTFCGRMHGRTDGHTYWRMDISSSNVIRSTWRSRPNNVVTVIRQGHTAHGRFSGIRQVSSMCIPSNKCFLGPTRVHIPNGMSIYSAVFAQLTAQSLCTLQ